MEMFDFKLIGVVMLFVILISIQITLNKILVTLKEIKRDIRNRNTDFIDRHEGTRGRY